MSALVRLFIFFLLGFVLLGHFFSLTFINSTKSKSKFHGKIVTLYFPIELHYKRCQAEAAVSLGLFAFRLDKS